MDPCSLCPRKNTIIPPSGPGNTGQPLFIGEAPGTVEDKAGEVFKGKMGVEFNDHYLPVAGLRRAEQDVTNAIKCLPTTAGGKLSTSSKKDLQLLDSCALKHLYQEILERKPSILVPMGAFACRAVDPAIDMDTMHGHVVDTQWGIPAMPMFHPARGMHEPKKMLQIRTDWQRLKRWRFGKLQRPVDAYPHPDYREATEEDIYALDPSLILACDTESSRRLGPYYLTYTQRAGVGRLIRADSPLLGLFADRVRQWRAPVLFHNWLYDRKIVREMGLRYPEEWIRDTMMLAFHLGNLPQGLKALAWRELGMEMRDFIDVVRPHATRELLAYYRRIADETWPKPDPETVRDDKNGGKWKLYKPQGMGTKIKVFWTYYHKNPDGKDIVGSWDNWERDHAMIEERLGPWPGEDIADVPFDEALHYACRDADATFRIYPILRKMRRRVRAMDQERWSA